MRNLFTLFLNYIYYFLFIVLQAISIYFVTQNFHYQKASTVKSISATTGWIYAKKADITKYLYLTDANDLLVEENRILRSQLDRIYAPELIPHYNGTKLVFPFHDSIANTYKKSFKIKRDTSYQYTVKDTTGKQFKRDTSHTKYWVRYKDTTVIKHIDTLQEYKYISSRIINMTINQPNNYMIIDKGSKEGVEKEMAVLSGAGMVGIVKDVTDHYAIVMPIINQLWIPSAQVKRNKMLGSIRWKGFNPDIGKMEDVPMHVPIQKGDTIVSSAVSTLFPEGVTIGYVTDISNKEGSFQDISIRFATNFRTLQHVYMLVNTKKKSQEEILQKLPK